MTTQQQDISAGTQKSMKQVTVRIPADLHRRFRLAALRRGESLNALVAGWISRWVEAKEREDA